MKTMLSIISLCWALSVAAAHDKDQALTIVADAAKNCIAEIVVTGDDNCKMADGKRGDCEGQPNCVCSKPDKYIEWQSSDIQSYTVYFYDDSSPFKPNCKLDANAQGKLKCRVKADAAGTYDYGVKVAGCDDFDPRIIIK
jgi:hypothetical protein